VTIIFWWQGGGRKIENFNLSRSEQCNLFRILQDNSDKKLLHKIQLLHLLIFLYIYPILHSLSWDSIFINLHICLPLCCCFLLVVGRWLSCTYSQFLTLTERPKFCTLSETSCFHDLENPRTFSIPNQTLWTPGHSTLKPIKTGLCWENWNKWDPYTCNLFFILAITKHTIINHPDYPVFTGCFY